MSSDGKKIFDVKNWLIPFSALFIILAYLSFLTLSLLLQPLSWAVLLAFLSYPAYTFLNKRLLKGKYTNVCALIMTIFIILAIIAPTIIAGSMMAKEAIDFYNQRREASFTINDILPQEVSSFISSVMNDYPKLEEVSRDLIKDISLYVFQTARGFLGNTLGILYSLLIIFISYFFLIRDGHIILNYVKDIVPLVEEEQMKFMIRGRDTLRGVVYGITFTAVIQGILGAIGWWIVDMPAPLSFGALMAFMALIPLIGTPSVWLPGSIHLYLSGDYKNALILLLWGIFVVSMMDNVMRPKFTSDKANISTFLVFIGAFGGIIVWGFLGLFIGPLILSLSVFFLDSYREIWKLSIKPKISSEK
jgi:predicted PurR-regulated permease PerM